MSDVLMIIGIIIIGAGLVIWLFLAESKKKNDEWEGTLEDKKVNKYFHRGEEKKDHLLFFKTDSGKKITYSANADIYDTFEKGDRARKQKGEYYPTRLQG